jgi:hypothetical protein
LLGDFNVPGFDWYSGLPSTNCYYYAKLKGEVIYSSICFLWLRKYNYSKDGFNLLDLVFSDVADFTINPAEYGIVQPDHYHSPFIVDCIMPIRLSKHRILFIFLLKDVQLVTIYCYTLPFLIMTVLLCIRNPLLIGSMPL